MQLLSTDGGCKCCDRDISCLSVPVGQFDPEGLKTTDLSGEHEMAFGEKKQHNIGLKIGILHESRGMSQC